MFGLVRVISKNFGSFGLLLGIDFVSFVELRATSTNFGYLRVASDNSKLVVYSTSED